MAARATGFTILGSCSVQEAHDFAIISHLATLLSSVPILHFCDGFRTTHEIKKIRVVGDELIQEMMGGEIGEALLSHRQRGLNPLHPDQRGI
jgi:pyruvate-ferredoxin/flavodoxin oxidoreductase